MSQQQEDRPGGGLSPVPRGTVVCGLNDLMYTSEIKLSPLARRVQVDWRRLDEWAKNRAERFHLDTLARLCAIFGGIPVQLVLRYEPAGEEVAPLPGEAPADLMPPTREIAVVRALPALPDPHGSIAFLWEQQGWSPRRLAAEIHVREETLEELNNSVSQSIARHTLTKLCWRLGGIEHVMQYTPPSHLEELGSLPPPA